MPNADQEVDVPHAADDARLTGRRPLEPKRSDARRNKDRVIEAAISVLSEDPDATMEDVARAAEVTRSTIYRRFTGRDQLLTVVKERLVDETQAIFREAVAREPDFARCMSSMFRTAVRKAHERRRIWQHLIDIGNLPRTADYEPQGPFVAWLEEGQRNGDVRADVPVGWLVTVWMQMVNAGSIAVDRNGIGIDEAARLAAEAAARVLRPDGPAPESG